ncbi:MAG: 2-amino-4-hydroxy-6-hydroxymethyldihydropteridine diphosphokinase [Rhodospirillales bacterium]|jgi:2-amino-4-hydroxy-6-hydroxymethyldihydropteridine diphosphokinase|nr:2-amino-4-hydroxy-6-hydroxymethyldihydropteridine diphosphokinase [Rhodospirillales bacterium]
MILIGIGSNISGPQGASPRQNCHNALKLVEDSGVAIVRRSRWYRSAPVPASDQPWFINGVVAVEAAGLEPEPLLELFHQIELEFGRRRGQPNAPRPLDLDILDFEGRISGPGAAVVLPHPRMHQRAFVLVPLSEIAPEWRHPVIGDTVFELIAALPDDQFIEPVP